MVAAANQAGEWTYPVTITYRYYGPKRRQAWPRYRQPPLKRKPRRGGRLRMSDGFLRRGWMESKADERRKFLRGW